MPGGWTMSMTWMRMPGQGWPGAAAVFLGMWTVMMVAMMLPALVPMLLAYRRALAQQPARPRARLIVVSAGYFGVWLLLGAALFPAGVAIGDLAMRDSGIARFVPIAAACALGLAGAAQLGEWKRRALVACRECAPHGCVRDGSAAAWRHGVSIGLRCARCCAPWTAALLVLGVMDPLVMAVVTVAIGLERLLPIGDRIARVGGIALLAAGALVLANA